MDLQLAAVGVGQRAERVVVPKSSETECALCHRRIVACPLSLASTRTGDRNTIRAANSSLSSRRLWCFVKQKRNTETKRRTKWERS